MNLFKKKKIIPDSFNDEINNAIKTICYDPKNIIFAGSFAKKAFRDASDIDICEKFGSNDKKVSSALQTIVKKILKNPNYIILDIKSGLIPYFINSFKNLGYIENSKIIDFDSNQTLKEINLHKSHIDKETFSKLIKLCKPNISLSEYFELCELIRKLITMRWTPEQVLKGENEYMKLVDAMPLFITKIDMAFIYAGFFTEISNVFSNESSIKNGFTFPPLSADPKNYKYCIKFNLLEYIVNNKPLKALKRVWTLASLEGDLTTLNKLYPIISSNLSIINKANAIIKTCISIIELYGNQYNEEIKLQLNNLKPFLSYIYQFPFNEKHIDELLSSSVSLKLLENISDRFDNTINKITIGYNFKIPKKYIL
jgi:hypothetical protein